MMRTTSGVLTGLAGIQSRTIRESLVGGEKLFGLPGWASQRIVEGRSKWDQSSSPTRAERSRLGSEWEEGGGASVRHILNILAD